MLRKISHSLLAATLVLGAMASTVEPAEARRGRGLAIGLAAGIIGLGVAAAIADERRHNRHYRRHYRSHAGGGGGCYPGPEECGWSNRHCFQNDWGDTVCRGGRWTCWRPQYCD